VLMDILLPGKMDGIEAAEEIRRRFDIPVVYITASSDEATLSRAKVTEPFGYILKPFDERGLYSTIEMALYKHQSEKRIRDSEERFRLLYEHAPVAFQSLDADGHLLQVNNAWQDLFGYAAEDAMGKWFGEFLAPNSVERFIANFTQFRYSPVTDNLTLDVVTREGKTVSATFKGSIAVDQRGMFEMTQCVLESRFRPSGEAPVIPSTTTGGSSEQPPQLPLRGPWLLTSAEGVILGITPAIEFLIGLPGDRLCGMMLHDVCQVPTDAPDLLGRLTGVGTLEPRRLNLKMEAGGVLETIVTGFVFHGQAGMTGSCCLHIRKS
jgi:PAS domain S-box-containing protein